MEVNVVVVLMNDVGRGSRNFPTSVVWRSPRPNPGVKGDTATGGTQTAHRRTGGQIMVPLFIHDWEKIKIDTRQTTSYLGRESGGTSAVNHDRSIRLLRRPLSRAIFRSSSSERGRLPA